jgi:hypothetical protein
MISNLRFQISDFKSKISNGIFLFFFLVSSLSAAETKKVVIPFDFTSKFDDGRYGQIIGDMLLGKLSQEGGFILPESMLDVRDYCTAHALKPSPEMDLELMRKIVQDDFDAHIGIWGSIERAPGATSENYDLIIRCVDFSAKPNPKTIYEVKARTNSAAEISHLYVKQLLDALHERKSANTPDLQSIAENNWKNGPNRLSGDFENGLGGVPTGWDKYCGQQREPLGRLVQWTTEDGNPNNKVVHFAFDKNVAENEGLMYYSDFFPIDEGAKYRFQCRWRSKGPAVKVFIKCYDEIDGQRREVYRSQQNLRKSTNAWTWNTHTEDFTPKHTNYAPRWCRVMLYAYLVPGEVEFDDVIVKQIVPPPTETNAKVRRRSTDTKITIEEMEKNERNNREIKRNN